MSVAEEHMFHFRTGFMLLSRLKDFHVALTETLIDFRAL